MLNHKPTVIVGIDLAGSSRRPTGVCILHGMKAHTHLAYRAEEILSAVDQAKPDLVPIDAPLSLPNGRKTIHDRSGEHLFVNAIVNYSAVASDFSRSRLVLCEC